MADVDGRLSVTGLTPLNPGQPIIAKEVLDPEVLARMERFQDFMQNRPTDEDRAALLAAQRAIKAHTVYSVNGKVIGMHQRNGWTTMASNTDGGAGRRARDEAAERGLTGEAANGYIAGRIGDALREKYGAALKVETYLDAATAPASGRVHDLMFGREPAGGPPPSPPSRLAYDPATFTLLTGGSAS